MTRFSTKTVPVDQATIAVTKLTRFMRGRGLGKADVARRMEPVRFQRVYEFLSKKKSSLRSCFKSVGEWLLTDLARHFATSEEFLSAAFRNQKPPSPRGPKPISHRRPSDGRMPKCVRSKSSHRRRVKLPKPTVRRAPIPG